MDDALRERVEALERAVTDGEHDLSALAAEAEALERLDTIDEQCDELENRVAELEAATQALRGYVGNVRAVNEEVENKAETALSKAESLEAKERRAASGDESHSTPHLQHAESQTPGRSSPPPARVDGGTQATATGTRRVNGQGTQRRMGGERSRSHCRACGQAQPGDGEVDEGADSAPGGNLERDEQLPPDGHSSLHQNDPLLAEDSESPPGALGRLKQLL